MSSGDNTSERITSDKVAAVAIPLCVWAMISALVLYLIDVRNVFLHGGELKLRQATLAFALGVILIQRLGIIHGRSEARAYSLAMGISILTFAGYHALTFPSGVHPAIGFTVNVMLYAILWWVSHHITAACSVDSDEAVERAASSGILTRGAPLKKRKWKLKLHAIDTGKGTAVFEPKWEEKPPARHPGRIILWFSAVALPVFAAGPFIFPEGDPSRFLLGVWFAVYMWCALALLSLASLRQLAVYFEQRNVTLPDMVGLTWMAIAVAAITAALAVAWILPQPPTAARFYVREQVLTSWRGWEAKYGYHTQAKPSQTASQQVVRELKDRYADIDRMNDPGLSQAYRDSGFEPEYRNLQAMRAAFNDQVPKLFRKLISGIVLLAMACALFVLVVVILVMAKRGFEGVLESQGKRTQRRGKEKEKRERARAAAPAFSAFEDPFGSGAPARDASAIVKHMWAATLAWCAQMGAPCPPDRTALEYVADKPEPLTGFEDRAQFLADWFAFAEYSGQPVPDTVLPELQAYWIALSRHVHQV
ncbi:DUF4129 domain-containing protein [bacterium]|nr:DUF4129 domain-containing protein [bacterium]